MSRRSSFASVVARATGSVVRRLRLGGGSALPGLIALRLHPGIIDDLRAQLAQVIVVSGTNGKTTTALLLREILRADGRQVVANETGSNLERGVAASLIEAGRRVRGATAVLEIDEAVLPLLVDRLRPDVVVLTNLFRDQLDRYGEVDMVAAGWTRAFGGATAAKHLVLNADDPVLAGLAGTTSAQVSLFGLEDINGAPTRPEHGADPRRCPVCGGPLEYSAAFFGHVGHYVCANRDWQRPRPDVSGDDVEHSGLDGTTFRLSTPRGSSLVRLSIGGLYNVHNALAAAAGGLAVGASLGNVHRGLEQARPAFGRLQQVQVAGKRVRMLLIKNPVGATAVFRAAYEAREPGALLIALNDNIADGTDVSWIWDVDFSTVASHETKLVVSGVRAEDLAVRLKYAGVPAERMHVESNLAKALGYAVEVTPAARELLIMPTYTAMLELQAIVQRLGAAPSYWEAVHREW